MLSTFSRFANRNIELCRFFGECRSGILYVGEKKEQAQFIRYGARFSNDNTEKGKSIVVKLSEKCCLLCKAANCWSLNVSSIDLKASSDKKSLNSIWQLGVDFNLLINFLNDFFDFVVNKTILTTKFTSYLKLLNEINYLSN